MLFALAFYQSHLSENNDVRQTIEPSELLNESETAQNMPNSAIAVPRPGIAFKVSAFARAHDPSQLRSRRAKKRLFTAHPPTKN